MGSVTTAQSGNGAANSPKMDKVDWRNVPKTKRATLLYQPQFQGVDGKSKLQVAKPLTKKARRIVTNKTIKLIRRREELDRDLLAEAERKFEDLDGNDWLPRENLLRRCDAVAKREKRHLRSRTRALEERTRLYKWDPSTERAHDLDLIRELLWKFKRNLGPYLKEREKTLQEDDGESSSAGSDSGDDEAGGAALDDSKEDSDESSEDEDEEDEPMIPQYDGAFDDSARKRKQPGDDGSTKRKSGKEPRKKKLKKEQDNDAATSGKMSKNPKTTADEISKTVTTHNLSMVSTRSNKVYGSTEKNDGEQPNGTVVTTNDEATMNNFSRLGPSMLEPGFDDHVLPKHTKRSQEKRTMNLDYMMSGAIVDPDYDPFDKVVPADGGP